MFYRYRFETEIYASLSRIPLHVRMKLDLIGIKISLRHWLAFSLEERSVLCHLPFETEDEKRCFAAYMGFLQRRYAGEEATLVPPVTDPPWERPESVPEPVRRKSAELGAGVTEEEWRRWDRYQRYALYKLSLSHNEPEQFIEALREFREKKGEPT